MIFQIFSFVLLNLMVKTEQNIYLHNLLVFVQTTYFYRKGSI